MVGGIIGAGIFINPYIVARRLDSEALVLAAWIVGGAIALAGRARRLIEGNSRLVRDFLAGQPLLECAPFAATIAFPRYRDGRDAGPFLSRLFEEHRVAVVSGAFFGLPSHFRISLGGSPGALREGLEAAVRCLPEP
ncbi:MAG: aminotransferase class I/II-fold pyridoxal phosphate-dependent enzyme [Thermoanaerobaculia bacterium]